MFIAATKLRRVGVRIGVAVIGLGLLLITAFIQGPIEHVDMRVALHFWPITHSHSTRAAAFLAKVGQPHLACIVLGALACVVALFRRSLGPLLLTAVGLITIGVVTAFLKDSVGRKAILGAATNSFPSGHTGVAVVAAGLTIALLLHPKLRHRNYLVLAAAAVWGAIMAWGRVVSESHWVSDVIGGWGLGMAVLAIALMAEDWHEGNRGSVRPTQANRQ